MNLHLVYRKFNYEHASCGAPFTTRNTDLCVSVTNKLNFVPIFLSEFTSLVCPRSDKIAMDPFDATWHKYSGRVIKCPPQYETPDFPDSLDLIMLPLAYIDGRPVFVDDELWGPKNNQVFKVRPEYRDFEGCKWPEPAHEWLTSGETYTLFNSLFEHGINQFGLTEREAYAKFANAAIELAIKRKLVTAVNKE